MSNDHSSCQSVPCWACWFRTNCTVIGLWVLLLLSLTATVILMHEESIEDKYVSWLENWDVSVMTALALAIKPPDGKPVAHTPPAEPPPTTP